MKKKTKDVVLFDSRHRSVQCRGIRNRLAGDRPKKTRQSLLSVTRVRTWDVTVLLTRPRNQPLTCIYTAENACTFVAESKNRALATVGNDSASGTPYRFVNTPRGYAPGEKPVAWASLTSRSKSLEDDRKCLSVTTSFLPTDRDFLFRALFSLSVP